MNTYLKARKKSLYMKKISASEVKASVSYKINKTTSKKKPYKVDNFIIFRLKYNHFKNIFFYKLCLKLKLNFLDNYH